MAVEHAVTRTVRDSAAILDVISGSDLGEPFPNHRACEPRLDELFLGGECIGGDVDASVLGIGGAGLFDVTVAQLDVHISPHDRSALAHRARPLEPELRHPSVEHKRVAEIDSAGCGELILVVLVESPSDGVEVVE
jgi:hypothetical protein